MSGRCRWSPLPSRYRRAVIDGRLRSFSSLRLDALADGPDKAREFARERHHDLVVIEAPGVQAPVLGTQTQLRPPGNRAQRGICFSIGQQADSSAVGLGMTGHFAAGSKPGPGGRPHES